MVQANAQSLMKTSRDDFLSNVVSFFPYFLSLVQKVTFWRVGKGALLSLLIFFPNHLCLPPELSLFPKGLDFWKPDVDGSGFLCFPPSYFSPQGISHCRELALIGTVKESG